MMKQTRHYRRILAAILAVVLTVGMSLTAFAGEEAPASGSSDADANKGKITIDNPIAGKTYSIYKIFNVTYMTADDGTKSYSYSIDGTSKWYTVVKTYAQDTNNGLILTRSAGSDKYVVTAVDTGDNPFSAADFAKHLSENVGEITPDYKLGPVAEGEKTLIEQYMPLGYYFVKGTSGALCNLTTTDPEVTIHDKNDVPFGKEFEEDEANPDPETNGVNVGQKLTYKITGVVPDTDGFETYIYRATDIMDEGLTFNKDVKVTIGGTEVTLTTVTDEADLKGNTIMYVAAGTYTYPGDHNPATKETGGGFKLSLDVKGKDFGQEILISYSATVNEKAVSVISKNEAVLEYGDNPDDLFESNPQVVRTFSSKIVIDKYDQKSNKKLAGAKFVLKRGIGADAEYYNGTFNGDELVEVNWVQSADVANAEGELIVPVVPKDITVAETNENGAATFEGLKNGTYYLVETEAPTGYNLLTEPEEVTIAATLTGEPPVLDGETVTVEVPNSNGSFLPSTGGIGTTIFYVLGSVLLVVAGAWFVISRRKAQTEEK